jgi:hypothetical protein
MIDEISISNGTIAASSGEFVSGSGIGTGMTYERNSIIGQITITNGDISAWSGFSQSARATGYGMGTRKPHQGNSIILQV